MLFVRNIADPLAHKWHHDDLMVDKNFFTDPSQWYLHNLIFYD
jgi:hypothetical protein